MRDNDYHHRKAMKTGSCYHWKMYKKLRNFLTRETKASKSLYYNNLSKESKGNTQKMWKVVNETSSRSYKSSSPNCIISGEVYYTDNKSIAEILNKYFVSVGQVPADKFMMATSDLRTGKSITTTCINFQEVEEAVVVKQIQSLRANKSIGLDKISNKLLKDAVTIISPSLTKLFNLSIRSHKFPELWKCAKVSAIFKSDDRTNPSNYRPISVLPVISKILEKIVHVQYMNTLIPTIC